MDKEEISKKTYELIAETLGISGDGIRPEAKIDDLCKDSIQIFALIIAFEKKFEYQAQYKDLIRIETVRDIIDYIQKIKK